MIEAIEESVLEICRMDQRIEELEKSNEFLVIALDAYKDITNTMKELLRERPRFTKLQDMR